MYTTVINPAQTVFKMDGKIFNFANICTVKQEYDNPETKPEDNAITIFTVDGQKYKIFGYNVDTFWDILFGDKQ